MRAVEPPRPPHHLLLGKDAVEGVTNNIEQLCRDYSASEFATCGTELTSVLETTEPKAHKSAMAKLTTQARDNLPGRSFALKGRRYPIEDIVHARNALARVSQDGTPAEQDEVRRKVSRLYPGLRHKD